MRRRIEREKNELQIEKHGERKKREEGKQKEGKEEEKKQPNI